MVALLVAASYLVWVEAVVVVLIETIVVVVETLELLCCVDL